MRPARPEYPMSNVYLEMLSSALPRWFFQTAWLGNSVFAWLMAALGALLGLALGRAVVAILGARLAMLAERRSSWIAAMAAGVLAATRGWLLLLLSVAIALGFLDLPERLQTRLGQLEYLLVGWQVALWLTQLIRITLARLDDSEGGARTPVLTGILSWTAQLVVWTILLLAVLSNVGVNVNALVASLGVGGVAVALAAQNVLGDLFASISIGLDKPFEVGEFIAFGDDLGTVQRVGIKSTRILALSGEEVAVSNSDLLTARVHNYSRMRERRIAFGFRVAADTPRAKAERIVQTVSRHIAGMDRVRLDRGHMTGFGEYSLDFEFVYYVLDPSFLLYRDIQQRINFHVMDTLEHIQVRLALPARLLHQADPPRLARSVA